MESGVRHGAVHHPSFDETRERVMAITFILGRAGTGKTRLCVDALLAELARPADTRRLILLVPEQASFQMERALTRRAPGGGYTRAAVLSFSRLAQQVFDATGTVPDILSASARGLALRRVVALRAADLRVLRPALQTAGFFVELQRLVEEFLRENVQPADLETAAARLDDTAAAAKIRELTTLYADYLAWLGPARVDAAAQLAAVRSRLAGLEWLPQAAFWVDGFAGFTGQELETLLGLARLARDMTIALLADPAAPVLNNPRQQPDPLGLFNRTETTYQRLLKLFANADVAVSPPTRLQPAPPPRFTRAPALATLEAALATPLGALPETARPASPAAAPPDLQLVECATHRDELRAAARWIRTQMVTAGGALRFRDFAVIARDLEPFAALIAEVFAEYEIPYFLDRRRPLQAHPLARLLPAIFEALATDFDTAPLVRLLRTQLLPLPRDDAEQLENLVVRYAVRGAVLWQQPTWELERAQPPQPAYAPHRARLMAAFEPLRQLAATPRGATGATWARALTQALEDLAVRAALETWITQAQSARHWEQAELHRQAWDTLCDLLQQLHDVLGDTALTAVDVAAILASALGEATLGLAPPTVDQVLVSAIERSRHPDIKYAWVFAFNEGIFPAPPADDTLLSTSDRTLLLDAGLPAPAPHRTEVLDERLLAYIALTRPSHGLTISYARVDDGGGELLPSPRLADVQHALPALVAIRPAPHAPPASLADLAAGFLATREDDRLDIEHARYAHLRSAVAADAASHERLTWLLRGTRYDNQPPPVGNFRASPDAGAVWSTSPSEIEAYLQCPFQHFATFGLRLDAQRGPLPLRWDFGTLAHELLATVTRRALHEPGGARALPPARWQQLLDEAIADYWKQQPANFAELRPDFAVLGHTLTDLLRDVVAVHAARWRRGQFEPRCCEQRFAPQGIEDALPALALALPDGQHVHVRGSIDRIDACRHGDGLLLLIYDYKSRAAPVKAPYLTGHRLQTMLYALAAQQGRRGSLPVRPAGVLLAPLYPDFSVLGRKYMENASPDEQLMYFYRPRGLLSPEAAEALDTSLSPGAPSPVASIQRKKDGGYHAKSDVCPTTDIEQRLELARQTVQHAADGVTRGAIEVAPLVEGDCLACNNCDFQPVCRFDRAFNRPRATTSLPQLPGADDEGADE